MIEGGKRIFGKGKTPKVSIITVTYNAAPLLTDYFENVKPYLSDDVELIIIDGRSIDATLYLLQQNGNDIDYWLSETDNGIYDAMNKGVICARGQWLYFLGADDYLKEGFTQMVAQLKDKNTIYYGDTIYYGKHYSKIYNAYYLTKLNFVHQSLFYPRSVFDKYQYEARYRVYADYHLNLLLWGNDKFRFEHRPLLIAGFPEGGFSTHEKDPEFEKDRNKLFKKHLGRAAYYRYLNRSIGWFKTFFRIISNG